MTFATTQLSAKRPLTIRWTGARTVRSLICILLSRLSATRRARSTPSFVGLSFRTKTAILISLGTVFLFSWFLFIYLYYFHWRNVAPIRPNPAAGQIYEVNNHGYVFYLTKQQEITAFIPCGIGVVSFLMGAVLERRWKVYERIYGKPSGSLL